MNRKDGLPKRSRWEGHVKASPVCKLCGENDINKFYKDAYSPCKACRIKAAAIAKTELKKIDYEGFKEKNRKYANKAYWENPDKFRNRSNDWRENNIELARERERQKYKNGGLEYSRIWRDKNRERVNEIARNCRNKNINKALSKLKEWRSNPENKLKEKKTARIYYYNNREKMLDLARIWREENPAKLREQNLKRRFRLEQRTPMWLNIAHYVEMDGYYMFCDIFSIKEKLNVDHIYPVAGKIVSGLHAPWNMQILTRQENSLKRNNMPSSVAPYIERPTLRINDDGTCETEFID